MACRVLSEEQSALSVELLASLAAAERGDDAAARGDDGPRSRVKEALRRERALEAQKKVLRAAAREEKREAAAAAAAPAPRELLPTVRLTLRSKSGESRAVVVRRKDGVAPLHALAVSKLKVKKSACHALCAGVALLSLDAVPDESVIEFAEQPPAPPPEARAEPQAQADDAADSASDSDGDDGGLFGRGEPAAAPPARMSASMAAARASLPMASQRSAFLSALEANRVLLLQAETGSGKSTQAPQFVLEACGGCCVLVAQPRRVAAVSLAQRVAAERGERVGDTVGYAVRGDSARSPRNRLLYITTGILLRALTKRPGQPGAPLLRGVTHVFVDECHERSIAVDMCLLLLRRALAAAPPDDRASVPSICLMSATAGASLASYFGAAASVMSVPGRAFPVRKLFLEDVLEAAPGAPRAPPPPQFAPGRPRDGPAPQNRAMDMPPDVPDAPAVAPSERDAPRPPCGYSLIIDAATRAWDAAPPGVDFALLAHAVTHAAKMTWQQDAVGVDDAILVFLPGAAEILRAALVLTSHAPLRAFCGGLAPLCAPLHGQLPPKEHAAAFAAAPRGSRKIVLATNVAETSVTIPDVAAVVDACRVRAPQHDAARGVTALQEAHACQASLAQRAGRAGRVRAGIALRLLSRATFDALPRDAPPEMTTAFLDNALLSALAALPRGATVSAAVAMLRGAPSPPPPAALAAAAAALRDVGATSDDALTPLGRILAKLPADVRVAKMLVLAALLGCLPGALTAAAALGAPRGGPFLNDPVGDAGRRRLAAGRCSDTLAAVAAFDAWRAARSTGGSASERALAAEHGLSLRILGDMAAERQALQRHAQAAGLPGADDDDVAGRNADTDDALLRAVLAAALWPRVGRVSRGAPQRRPGVPRPTMVTGRDAELRPHARSVNASGLPDGSFCAWLEASAAPERPGAPAEPTPLIRDSTRVPPLALALFCGELRGDPSAGAIALDGWLRLRASPTDAALLRLLRKRLDAALLAAARGPAQQRRPEHAATLSAVATLLRLDPTPALRTASDA
jgi:HrpA-like RNA helicase